VSDFIDSAMGRLVGINETVRVGEAVEEQWGLAVMAVPGFAGLLLALPLAAIAAWRAAQLPWWGPVSVIAGMAAFIGFDATLPGNVLLTVAFAVLAAALTRIDPDVWQSLGTLPAIRAASPLVHGLKSERRSPRRYHDHEPPGRRIRKGDEHEHG
jgi:hypothetical protein